MTARPEPTAHGRHPGPGASGGGRGVYIRDPDGIAYEFFTAVP
jgi:catechol 2,3-dioxygenase-like lactoylglutathione lyase family enzyme